MTFERADNTTTLNQATSNAIVNWQDFSIGTDELVRILQPDANSALLNRVVGASASNLLGKLEATGRVYLLNPNGIVVGKDASINAASFFATTAQVSDEAFLDGNPLAFSNGTDASIVNLGVIRTTGGDAVLVAYRVVNDGEISAPQGTAGLVSATEFVYGVPGYDGILVSSGTSRDVGGEGVTNGGLIEAANAQLAVADGAPFDLAINQTGIVRATGIQQKNGRVLLTANRGSIRVDGELSAHDSDGSGGAIRVGTEGSERDGDVAIADYITVASGAHFDVSAQMPAGDGGTLDVRAEQQTDFAGTIDGRAGRAGGDGASIEVSAAHVLNYYGVADLSAALGTTGTLLLDPDAAVISTDTDDQVNGVFNVGVLQTNLAGSNVVIDTSTTEGDISVNSGVAWSSANSLTLKSADDININNSITASNGSLVLLSGFKEVFYAGGQTTGDITVAGGATLTAAEIVLGTNTDAYIGNGPNGTQTAGTFDINGALITPTLEIQSGTPGILEVAIDNAANQIGTLKTTSGNGLVTTGLIVADSAGGLAIDGPFENLPDDITISTVGDLTLNLGAKVTTSGSFDAGAGDVTLAAIGGSFINNAGASAVSSANFPADVRTLVYSDDPANTTLGGLSLTPVYDRNFLNNAPGSITRAGDRVLYDVAPILTLTADDKTRNYGSANPALTYTVSGLLGSDTEGDSLSGTAALATSAATGSDIGSYAISIAVGSLASDYNYGLQFADGQLTVDPAPLTIKADNKSKTKDYPNPALTATFTGLVAGDTEADVPGLQLSTTAVTSSPTGTYPIVASGAANSNYDIAFVYGTLTVNAVGTLTITADDVARLYGQSNPAFTSTIIGFDPGDDESLVMNLAYDVLADMTSPVGSYAITPKDATATGYEVNFVAGTLTVDPAPLTIAAANAGRFYGDADPAFDATYSGFVNGDASDVVSGLTLSTDALQASDVGNYTITPSGATAGNYAISYSTGVLTVDPAPLTISFEDVTREYGVDNPDFTRTVTGLRLGQSLADVGSYSSGGSNGFINSDVGTYDIAAGPLGPTNPNYTVTIDPGTLTIVPRNVTLIVRDVSRVYGDANPAFGYDVQFDDGLPYCTPCNSPVVQVIAMLDTDANLTSPVGNYEIFQIGETHPNYNITSLTTGTLSVTPAPLMVKAWGLIMNYGDPVPATGYSISGLKNGEALTDVVSNIAVDLNVTKPNAGSYPISISGTVIDSNYDVTFQPDELLVYQVPLRMVLTLSTRYFGDTDANTSFNFLLDGLVGGDTKDMFYPTFVSTANAYSPPGSYTFSLWDVYAPNYKISFNPGTLNVVPRPITVTADDKTKVYGDDNPELTATITNISPYENINFITGVTLTTLATKTSGASDFGIFVTSNPNPNYDITYEYGTLSITKAPINVAIGDYSYLYGRTQPDFQITSLGGLKLSDTEASIGLGVAAPPPTADVGDYVLTGTTVNPNYEVVGTGTLEVLPAPLEVTGHNVSRKYGVPLTEPLTASVFGLAFDDAADEVVRFTSTADVTSDAGQYPIDAELLSSNYEIASYDFGIETVLVRNIAARLANVARYYGDEGPEYTLLIGGDGLASFDTQESIVDTSQIRIQIVDSGSSNYVPAPYIEPGATAALRVALPVTLDNPNYAIKLEPSIHAILRRPITLTVNDATIGFVDAFPDAYDLITADNLAPGHTLKTDFPQLNYMAVDPRSVALEPTRKVDDPVTPEVFLASLGPDFQDQAFIDAYPVVGPTTEADVSSVTIGIDSNALASVPTDTTLIPLTEGSQLKIGDIIVISDSGYASAVLDRGQIESRLTQQLTTFPVAFTSSFGGDPNYTVIGVNRGTLSILPDPDAVDLELALEHQDENNRAAFLHPGDVTGNIVQRAFGLPDAALPSVIDAIGFVLGQSEGADALLKEIQKAGGGTSEGGSYTEDDLYAFLADIHTNPEKRAMVAPVLTRYLIYLQGSKPPASYTDVDRALIATFNKNLASAKQDVAANMVKLLEAKRADAAATTTKLSALFGEVSVYQQTLKEAAQMTVEANAGAIVGAATGGAVAVAGVSGAMATAASSIFPYAASTAWQAAGIAARAAGATAIEQLAASAGAEAAASATATTAAAAGPAVIVTLAITAAIARGTEVFKENEAQAQFEAFVGGAPKTMDQLNLDPDAGSTLDKAIFMAALSSMMGGI